MYNKSTTDAIVYLLITFIIVTVGGIQGTICPTIINTNRTTTAIILISKTMLYVITEIMLLNEEPDTPYIGLPVRGYPDYNHTLQSWHSMMSAHHSWKITNYL